jgi:manganese transport protein
VNLHTTAGLSNAVGALKPGLATGRSLPELIGQRLPRWGRLTYWVSAETDSATTDVAQVIGGAIALFLLFDLPLLWGGAISGGVSLVMLAFQNRRGQRQFRGSVTAFLVIIAIGFVGGLLVAPPSAADVASGLVLRFDGVDSLLMATAMLGATVMPHAVSLHSALSRNRFGQVGPGVARPTLLRSTRTDVGARSDSCRQRQCPATAVGGNQPPGT